MTSSQLCDIGVMGLAVMGQNLALNIAEHGFHTAVYNRTASKVDDCIHRAKEANIQTLQGFKDLKTFIHSLSLPRKIIILVKAGLAVDELLNQLIPLLTKNDLIIDGGNEWFELTEKRIEKMTGLGFRYMGMGVSGGEEGARYGPALMPGGSKEGYQLIHTILEKISAQVDDGPCVSYIGEGGSGNYVKMVHNGIEYGDMQLICEAYDILKQLGHVSHSDLNRIFNEWNQGELQSFLIEITANIFLQKDEFNKNNDLLDYIKDSAGSKGTGMWTVQEAARRGIPCPTIQAALDMRYMSTFKETRKIASKEFLKPQHSDYVHQLIDDVKDALYCSKVCSYAQGMMLLKKTSDEKNWKLNLGEVARGWKGGCIIRARLLDQIKVAFHKNSDLSSLLLDKVFSENIRQRIPGWRRLVSFSQQAGIPVAAFSASLAYFDAFTSEKLPVNLIQAQRDYFGAHTYERIDRSDGPFHTQWMTTTKT